MAFVPSGASHKLGMGGRAVTTSVDDEEMADATSPAATAPLPRRDADMGDGDGLGGLAEQVTATSVADRALPEATTGQSAVSAADTWDPEEEDDSGPPVAQFARTLYAILTDETTAGYCGWSKNGTRVVFRDSEAFGEHVCPRFFRHNKWSSFSRMLNMYQFKKVTVTSKTKSAAHTPQIYEHEGFQRGREDLLHLIQRKSKKKAPAPTAAEMEALRAQCARLENRIAELERENAMLRSREQACPRAKYQGRSRRRAAAKDDPSSSSNPSSNGVDVSRTSREGSNTGSNFSLTMSSLKYIFGETKEAVPDLTSLADGGGGAASPARHGGGDFMATDWWERLMGAPGGSSSPPPTFAREVASPEARVVAGPARFVAGPPPEAPTPPAPTSTTPGSPFPAFAPQFPSPGELPSVNEHAFDPTSPRSPVDERGRVASRAPVRKRRVG